MNIDDAIAGGTRRYKRGGVKGNGPCGWVYQNNPNSASSWQPLNPGKVITVPPSDDEPALNGVYNFVILKDGAVRLRIADFSYHHPDLIFQNEFANGAEIIVGYAGTVLFENGVLRHITNVSGHFTPNKNNKDIDCVKNILKTWSNNESAEVTAYLHPWRR